MIGIRNELIKGSRNLALSLMLALLALTPVLALNSSDLLFQLSFEDGVNPQFARGAVAPTAIPDDLARRLVDGVLGKGYMFAGKGSTIEFQTGDNGSRGCAEMYGIKANLLGDSGTISYWLKHLDKNNSQDHDFFRFGPNGAYRDKYGVCYFDYAGAQAQMYNTFPALSAWMNFAVSWRKGEFRSYLNGKLWSVKTGGGVVDMTPERFIVAGEGRITADFQKTEKFDDTVMDEVQIFGRPLTDEEILSIYERPHVEGKRMVGGNIELSVDKPHRIYEGQALSAPVVALPISIDGKLSDWDDVPSHGCLVDRRVGVLDDDPGKIYVASDSRNLYVGFYCPVDKSIQDDPTHIKYPTGEFKASPRDRDGAVYEDDYIEFALKGKDGHEYRYALNGRGSLLDSRDGEKQWNGGAKSAGRSDLKDWTAEIAIPLDELGVSPGEIVEFNAVRSWKLFKSSQNSLCPDAACQPGWGNLTVGSAACAAVETLGEPWNGGVTASGIISGPPGDYVVKIRGKGLDIDFAKEEKVSVGSQPTRFTVRHKLQKPGDVSLVVNVLDPGGKSVLVRTIPFVYVGASAVEVSNYPGWERVSVKVTPVQAEGARAVVSIVRGGEVVRTADIKRFDDPSASALIDTKGLAVGNYEVLTQLYRGDTLEGEDRQPYAKKALPEWYHSKAGIIDGPPIPWTDVQVKGSTVKLLIKDIKFNKTLFPAQIVSNGQSLLSGPVRIRVKRNGVEKIITAGNFKFTKKTRRRVDWVSTVKDGNLSIKVSGWIEFDGFTWMHMTLSGGTVEHLALEIPLRKESATLKTLDGRGLLGDKPLQTSGCGSWFGNEKAGIQYWWEDQRGWVMTEENVQVSKLLLRSWEYVTPPVAKKETNTVTPAREEVVISIPFIQKSVDLSKSRTVTFGWAVTPSKPIRKDWRYIKLHKGITYTQSYYSSTRPNYPSLLPGETKQTIENGLAAQRKAQNSDIIMWYAYGPFMWIGAPEYAEWWKEWQVTSWPGVPPNPNSTEWGWACHESSGSDLFLSKLEKFVKEYPQRGVYVDCYFLMGCDNKAHDCGYIDENGKRHMSAPLLATRRHYERMYNIIKAVDPKYGWIRIHDWGPIMPVAAFCDENWSGEGLIGPVGNTPEKNYYRVVDFPYARVEFRNEQWGHFQNWLTELGVYAGTDPKKREEWFGKMISPPKDGKHGEWILPRMADYDHVAGLALIHDMWQTGGNDAGIASLRLNKMMKDMGWDDAVRFRGYWDLADTLVVEGSVPEKVACSLYFRPAMKDDRGKPSKPWLMLVAMNNSDEDVTITLRPNLKEFGLERLANGRLRDMYVGTAFVYGLGNILNQGDPEPPYIEFPGVEATFGMENGAAKVTIPKRNFRALLLEQSQD